MYPATIPVCVLAAALAASGAGAQTAVDPSGSGLITGEQYANAIRADEAIEADIYSMNEGFDEAEWTTTGWYGAVGADWEKVGEVEDILIALIARDGQVIGLVVETGGWLDIGDESYVIDLRDLRTVGEGDDIDFVTRLSQEQMEAQPRAPEESWF